MQNLLNKVMGKLTLDKIPNYLLILVAAIIFYQYFGSDLIKLKADIGKTSSQTYNNQASSITSNDLIAKISTSQKPTLLFLYTTWCKTCHKTLPKINEIAREFQNADVDFHVITIDKSINYRKTLVFLQKYPNIYFKPYYISDNNIKSSLDQIDIKYKSTIPFTAILNGENKVTYQFSGDKSLNYIRNRLIKSL